MKNALLRQGNGKPSRREALKAGALASAGVVFAPIAHVSSSPPGPMSAFQAKNMHLSLAAYSMREALTNGSMDLFDFIDWCAELDLPGTELTSYYFPEHIGRDYLHRLRRHAFHRGVTVSGTAIRNNFCLPPGPEKQKEIEHVKRWIDYAVAFYAPHIRIFAGQLPQDVDHKTGINWVAEGIKKVLPHAEERGIVLGLENHGDFTGQVDIHLAICEVVGEHPCFGINLDTGNYLNNPYESLAKAAPRAVNVQLKTEVRGDDGTRVPVDLARIEQILVEASYNGWVALEYEAEDPRLGIPQYVKKLKEWL